MAQAHPRLQALAAAAALSAAAAQALPACTTLRPVVVAPKTTLETELLGQLERLNTELTLAAANSAASSQLTLSPPQQRLLQAMLDRQLTAPAIRELKQNQLIGESNDGFIAVLAKPTEPAAAERLEGHVRNENRARKTIMRSLIELNPELSDDHLPVVGRAFHGRQRQEAEPGDQLQSSDGSWRASGAE